MDRWIDRWKDREIDMWWYGWMNVDRGVVRHDEGGERWRKSRNGRGQKTRKKERKERRKTVQEKQKEAGPKTK